jgi:hypothetical protein
MHRCLPLLSLISLTACGTSVYQPARDAGFDLDPAFEINDQDIAKAFAARPQLPEKVRVSYYSFDDKHAPALAKTVESSKQVTDSYRIPSLLVTGKGRFDEPSPYPTTQHEPAPSIKKLRLLAARAKSDVLVMFDYGHRFSSEPNGWTATAVFIVPVFFAPMFDYQVESYLDTYVIDVKNGYLYAHLSSQAKDDADVEMLFSDVVDELLESQWTRIEQETRYKLAELLADPDLRVPAKAKLAADAPKSAP